MTRSRPRLVARHGRAPWRRWLPALLVLVLLLVAPALCWAQGAGADSVRMTWTSPGDDGNSGTAALYDMRLSTAPITLSNWSAARGVPGLPAPLVSGTRQQVTVRGLSRDTTYYLAIRTRDDAGNWSGVSNVVTWNWSLDTAPPAAPTGVAAAQQSGGVRVSWSPNSEPDLQGYDVHRATASGGPFTRINAAVITGGTAWLDASLPAGAISLWYRVVARDQSGNQSAPSATVRVDLAAQAPADGWQLAAGYPNPSRTGQSVCLPLQVPSGGPGEAVIEIVDAGGRRIRRFTVQGAPSCGGGVTWDGRNDAGREVAPGVYRAWLVAGDERRFVRLARQP
jgi:chitodextrinase